MALIKQPDKVVRYKTRSGKLSKWHVVDHVENGKALQTFWTMCDHYYAWEPEFEGQLEIADFADVPAAEVCGRCTHGYTVVDNDASNP